MAAEPGDKVQEILVACESEYPDYVYNSQESASVVVTLTAPVLEEDKNEENRPPIDLVAVIDKSGSMAGDKLNLVKTTLEFIISQLNNKDRLALVTYDTNVYLDFGLRLMNKDNKQDCLVKVRNVHEGSCTNLCGGLLAGLSQILDRPANERNDVASVLLLTDGLANEGISSAAGIIAAMKDVKANAPVLSKSEVPTQQSSASQQPAQKLGFFQRLRLSSQGPPPAQPAPGQPAVDPPSTGGAGGKVADASVYTFGFGSDHDPNLLKAISDAGNGMYYFIERDDQIAEAFGHCLGGLQSTVAQGIKMEVTFENGVSLKKLHSSRPSQHLDARTLKIDVGDLQSEETRDMVMEVALEPVAAPYTDTPQRVFAVKVHYYNVAKTAMQIATGNLTVLRPERVERKLNNVNLNVKKQFARVNLAEALRTSKLAADSGNLQAANEQLLAFKSNMMAEQEVFAERGLAYGNMLDDIDEVGNMYKDEVTYRSKGQHLCSNVMQVHSVQRAAAGPSAAYETKSKMMKKAAGRSFLKK